MKSLTPAGPPYISDCAFQILPQHRHPPMLPCAPVTPKHFLRVLEGSDPKGGHCHIPCPTRDRLSPPDPTGPRPGPPDPSPSIRTFCSTYFLLTHFLHVILGPHSGLRLPPDTRPTPLHHSVYPSTLLTLFAFTRLHPLLCTGLRLLSLLTGLRPDLLYGPAPLVYKSALLYARSLVLISR